MAKEVKSLEEYIEHLTPEQKQEAQSKVNQALKRIFDEGARPYEALNMPEGVLNFIYSEAYRFYRSGLYPKAQQFFALLMFLNPTEPKFILGQAACFQMSKQYQEAIEVYKLLTPLMPASPLPYFYIYECHMQLNEVEDARTALEKVVELAETDPEHFSDIANKAKLMLETYNPATVATEKKED